VGLRAAHHNSILALFQNANVQVRVLLLGGPLAPVSLHIRLGDRQRQVAVPALAIERPYPFQSLRFPAPSKYPHEREERIAADLLDQDDQRGARRCPGFNQFRTGEQVLRIARDAVIR